MILYPINLDVTGRRCVVVGGGKVALRKILGLLTAGAQVDVIAPEICAGVEELVRHETISWTQADFSTELLGDAFIVIAATNSEDVNRQVAKAAEGRKILVNVVEGAGGNFNVPATIRLGKLLLAISTGTNSPAFSKFVRQMLSEELGDQFGKGLEMIAARRREVKEILPNHEAREIFWQSVLTRETWELLKGGKLKELEDEINHALESFRAKSHDRAD